jgi:predicted hotdog family 3-hydroxylacyl-ACP dehydratase
MAAHGGLKGNMRRPRAGYLASLRDVVCCVERLDLLEGQLQVFAELLIADGPRVIYRFELTSDAKPVLSGRAAVVIDAGPLE